jgi:hypothetical protein
MFQIFSFIITHNLKNRTLRRLRRLRQPRYLIASILGIAYLSTVFLRNLVGGRAADSMNNFSPDTLRMIEGGASLILFLMALQLWLLPAERNALNFSLAEVQFLFTGPISRQGLVHYRLFRSQLAIFIGLAFLFTVRGEILLLRTWPHFFAIWMMLATMNLHSIGVRLTRTTLLQHGAAGWKRQFPVALLLILAGSALLWTGWEMRLQLAAAMDQSFRAFLNEALEITDTQPLAILLLPFRWVIRPALAGRPAGIVRSLIPAGVIFLLHYVWVVRTQAAFEEASFEAAERAALRRALQKEGRRSPAKYRKPPFELRSAGLPELALVWKNFILAGRHFNLRFVALFFPLLLVLGLTLKSAARADRTLILAGAFAGMAVILLLLGPQLVRNDLRQDLLYLETLKTFPLSGVRLVRAELLAPSIILVTAQWVLLILAAWLVFPLNLPYLPETGRGFMLVSCLLVGGSILVNGVLIQNAAVLFFPGWVNLGPDRAQGLEAVGQRLITLVGMLIMLLAGLAPAGLAGGVILWLTGRLPLGLGFLAAGIAASSVLMLEAALVSRWMGYVFERLDREAIL